MNKRMLELYHKAHVDYTAIDPSNNMPYKSACFSADRFAELIVQECTNFIDNWEEYQIEMSEQVHGFIPPTGGAKHLKAHFGVE